MKKEFTRMKKIICLSAAVAMLAAAAVPMTAFAEEQKDTTEVTFSVDPSYTVTIPASIELSPNAEGTSYVNTASVKADDVFLNYGEVLNVSIQSDFKMSLSDSADTTVDYEAYVDDNKLDNNGTVADFETKTGAQSKDITFKTTTVPTYAGSYSDTVTFVIAPQSK